MTDWSPTSSSISSPTRRLRENQPGQVRLDEFLRKRIDTLIRPSREDEADDESEDRGKNEDRKAGENENENVDEEDEDQDPPKEWMEDGPLVQVDKKIIKLIVKRMDLSSASSLAFTCKTLHDKMGTKAWNRLPDFEFERWKFIKNLERDLPFHRVCGVCGKLHPRENSGQPGAFQVSLSPCVGEESNINFCNHYSLRYEQLQLLERARQLGPEYGISEQQLFHSCEQTAPHGCKLQLKIIPRYDPVHGLMICKRFHLSGLDFRKNLHSQTKILYGSLCPHVTHDMGKLWECAVFHHHPKVMSPLPCFKCKYARVCNFCKTVYRVQTADVTETSCDVVMLVSMIIGRARGPNAWPWVNHTVRFAGVQRAANVPAIAEHDISATDALRFMASVQEGLSTTENSAKLKDRRDGFAEPKGGEYRNLVDRRVSQQSSKHLIDSLYFST
ncbi:hypothetical protein AJ80_03905 [Polytolypa hystricis UAMH7299]|uniref:Uncharacterized protein n=1 Tax=Polytolypa hystricis (strain UAMH7299) TaxID=1447883 RepID=A0A2B7YER3_POLH7|nr:hypothetical protein AJ80_03905 [Polytolypa hystricis UAMH7299]